MRAWAALSVGLAISAGQTAFAQMGDPFASTPSLEAEVPPAPEVSGEGAEGSLAPPATSSAEHATVDSASRAPPPEAAPNALTADRDALDWQLRVVNQRLDALERERSSHRLGGPIATMAAGGGVVLAGLTFVYAGALRDFDLYGDSSWHDDPKVHAGYALCAVGLVGVVAGVTWLARRIRVRKRNDGEIRDLRRRRRLLEGRLRSTVGVLTADPP